MSDEINWTLEELVTLYQLHPELRDVFVEGESDQGLLEWFMAVEGRDGVAVYPVSVVEVPEAKVFHYGLEHPNRRSEVITIALEIERECTNKIRVTFIADADGARIGVDAFHSVFLLFTDYTSMEMYAFKAHVIEKLLKLTRSKLKLTGQEVLDRLSPTLQKLFALRMASRELKWGLSWLSFERCARMMKRGYLAFDADEYADRYLNTKAKRKDLAEFRERVAQIEARFTKDPRNQIRGHDFVDVLAWFLSKSSKSSDHVEPETLWNLLMIQLTPDDLRSEPMFQALLSRTRE